MTAQPPRQTLDNGLRPEPGVVYALAHAHDDAVAAEVLRRLAVDTDCWRALVRDMLDLAAFADADALRAAADDLAPMPGSDYWEAQHARALAVARAMVDAHGT